MCKRKLKFIKKIVIKHRMKKFKTTSKPPALATIKYFKYAALIGLFLVFSISIHPQASSPATEVRAVWLTTNYGLDWPKNRTSTDIQRQELIKMLDNLKKYNFNTVFFQTRTRGAVLYKSSIEPMASVIARYDNYAKSDFDPLTFVIEECHKRGIECHAWIVTYPLGGNAHVKSLGNQSITKKNRSICIPYKGEWFLDPGNPKTDDYLLSIVKEIVSNYNIDGIQFDYIRYPNNNNKFPDHYTYTRFGRGKSLSDWRRENITRFVSRAYDWIKSVKPWVQVSSSPLGRYRPLQSGDSWNARETVLQDAGYWMLAGKHDALYPMMYYKNHYFYPYVDDWMTHANGRIIVPGLGAYQMIELNWKKQDIVDQIDYTRKRATSGQAYFRTENVLANTKGILFTLNDYYKYPAKLPPMTWLSDTLPKQPIIISAERVKGRFQLRWKSNIQSNRKTYNLYRTETDNFDVHKNENLLATGLRESFFEYYIEDNDKAYYYFVTVSDAFHNESAPCEPAFFYHSKTIK